jgi:chaperonin GroES
MNTAKETKEHMMKIRPLGDRVLVEPRKEEESKKGGIIIPDTAKEKPQEGKVIAVGPGKRGDDGKIVPMNVKVGNMVLMPKYGGTEVKIDDKEFQLVREEDILGIIE